MRRSLKANLYLVKSIAKQIKGSKAVTINSSASFCYFFGEKKSTPGWLKVKRRAPSTAKLKGKVGDLQLKSWAPMTAAVKK